MQIGWMQNVVVGVRLHKVRVAIARMSNFIKLLEN